MSQNPKLEGAIGLCVRAGKAVQGTDAVEQAVRAGKARLVLVDPSASENTAKVIRDLCAFYQVEALLLPEEGMLERITGKSNRRVFAVTENGFADMIRKTMRSME